VQIYDPLHNAPMARGNTAGNATQMLLLASRDKALVLHVQLNAVSLAEPGRHDAGECPSHCSFALFRFLTSYHHRDEPDTDRKIPVKSDLGASSSRAPANVADVSKWWVGGGSFLSSLASSCPHGLPSRIPPPFVP